MAFHLHDKVMLDYVLERYRRDFIGEPALKELNERVQVEIGV